MWVASDAFWFNQCNSNFSKFMEQGIWGAANKLLSRPDSGRDRRIGTRP